MLKFQAGAFPGSPVEPGCMCGFAMYDIAERRASSATTWCRNRPKVAAYRAPGAPIASFAVESVLDELARKLGMDPLELREKNARARRHQDALRADACSNIGYLADARGGEEPSALEDAARAEPGARHRLRLLVQHRRRVRARRCTSTRTAPSAVSTGSPDIGGSRASMAMMAAETLRHPGYEQVRPIVADTGSIGFTHVTGGCRVTFATGMAVTQAAEKVVDELKQRAAMIWDITPRRSTGRTARPSRPAPMSARSSRCRWPRSR